MTAQPIGTIHCATLRIGALWRRSRPCSAGSLGLRRVPTSSASRTTTKTRLAMRQVAPPAVDDEQVFDQIAAAKHEPRRGQLQAARAVVLSAYRDYNAAAPDVSHLPAVALNDLQKNALIHAYS